MATDAICCRPRAGRSYYKIGVRDLEIAKRSFLEAEEFAESSLTFYLLPAHQWGSLVRMIPTDGPADSSQLYNTIPHIPRGNFSTNFATL